MGHLELATAICRLQPLLLTRQNSKGDTPVHCAARAGHHAIVTTFVLPPIVDDELGEENVLFRLLRARNRVGNTALHEAALNGHQAVAQTIMFIDPDSAAVVNQAGVSPLYMAAPNGQTALHAAVLRSYGMLR
uniref:Ankyrin repeat-containing protein P16F5.05c-like n=1 Tax=Elaeis guineensis var. tenera TaxID=51953 RepID=A0A8N4IAQ8_ELAGV|nr:ankyrin repeat-containing protein P16F5.05c-like [Elaeis guineensis]